MTQKIHFQWKCFIITLVCFYLSGIRFHLSPVQLFHRSTVGGHLWSVGGVRLDGFLCGVHSSPWLPGLPVCGGRPDWRLLHWLGEEERGDPERDWRPWGGTHAQAAEGERGAGETGGREGGKREERGGSAATTTGGLLLLTGGFPAFSFLLCHSLSPSISLPSLLYPLCSSIPLCSGFKISLMHPKPRLHLHHRVYIGSFVWKDFYIKVRLLLRS